MAAPASAAVCPADGQVPWQLRDGDFALALTDDGMRVTDVETDAMVPNGSSVVVGDTSRRTGAAGIDGFVAPGAQYLATGSTGAPSFTWSSGGFDEPLDLQLSRRTATDRSGSSWAMGRGCLRTAERSQSNRIPRARFCSGSTSPGSMP